MKYVKVSERVQHVMDNDENFQVFLGLIRTGKPFGLACKACRISRMAMNTYLDLHPDRASMYIDAELEATEAVEQVLYEEALARQKWAVQLWLERRAADRWASAADAGPKRIVLDPAALKGMIGTGSPGAGVVDEDASAIAESAPDVALVDVADVDAGSALDLSADATERPSGREPVGSQVRTLLDEPPWTAGDDGGEVRE